jgi:hypothetical protein
MLREVSPQNVSANVQGAIMKLRRYYTYTA